MQISLDTAKKLNWLWKDENKIAWIETFIKIADKDGNIVPFILTDEQRKLVENLAHQNIISKSRQLGISVVTVALSIRACVVNPNTNCVLISHNQSSTNAVFDKLKQQFYSLPDWVRPKLIQNNRQALTFENGSSIVCMTAGNKDCGRGSTYSGGIVHLSEFAFWKDQQRQLKSIMQAVTSSSTVIIESTSNGYNEYSNLFLQARNGENAFKPFFFNWINGRSLFKSQYDESVKLYKAQHGGKMLTEDEYDDEESALAKLGMTPEQAVWRRDKISISGLDAFHVEYPSTPEESFLATGSSVFDNNKVIKLQQALTSQKISPLKVDKIVGLPQILRTYVQNKSLDIYKVPRVGMKYYIGVDVSEGLGGKHDYSTMFVMDKDGEQVAEFHNNKVQPYLYADICNAVGRFYNKALLCVEKASGGHSVIERLRYEHKYMNMVKYSSVAMQILYAMAQVNADETKKWLNIGFRERFERFKKILSMQGISVESDVDVIYNVSMPVATTEMIANLKALQEMGAISKETIMEKSDIVSDVEVEKKRLSGENVNRSPNGEQLKTTDNVDNSVDNLAQIVDNFS